MDKSTLSNYGWVVIVTLVLSVMLAFATPFGSYVARATANVIKYYKTVTGDTFNADYIEGQGKEWDNYLNDTVPKEKIDNDPYIYGIGKTKSEYVLAIFNEDYTHVDIVKNGTDSDGIMKSWEDPANSDSFEEYLSTEASPMVQHYDTLKKAVIKEGVINVSDRAFVNCKNLTTATFPIGLRTIGYNAFMGCEKLNNVTLPETLVNLRSYAFGKCSSLTSMEIPDSVTALGGCVFYNCQNLSYVKLPANITVLGSYIFYHCKSLKHIVIPNKVVEIGEGAFMSSGIQTLEIPDSVTTIKYRAFRSSGIKNLVIGKNVETIGADVFSYSSLETLTISSSVKEIGQSPFVKCFSLREIIVDKNNEYFKIKDNLLYTNDETEVIACPALNPYTELTISPNTITIRHSAFNSCEMIQKITLPNNLKTIEPDAFYGCTNLVLNTLSNNIETLGAGAFAICTKISSFIVPEKVTSIEQSTFLSCTTLKEITIHENVTFIADDIFKECHQTITIKGKANSYAETWANEHNYNFVAI